MTKSLTTKEFVLKSQLKHNFVYDYSAVNYVNAKTPVDIICSIHGKFCQNPFDHLGGKGCRICGQERRANSCRSSLEEFIAKANKEHNNRYDYSETNYSNNSSKIEIICIKHGKFLQIPSDHLGGKGCPTCANERRGDRLRMSTKEFIQKAQEKHNNFYDYSSVNYIDSSSKIFISCPMHGIFNQGPAAHLYGAGCPKCKAIKIRDCLRSSTEEFVKKSKIIHEDLYDYSKTEYKNNSTKVEIICRQHGSFWQGPDAHMLGAGCPKCSSRISKIEIKWLDSLNIPEDYRQKLLHIDKNKIKVDAYDSITNTIYEFWGDFWHGNLRKYKTKDINPKNKLTFGQLNRLTEQKRQLIFDTGHNLVEIWEQDFRKLLKENHVRKS